MTRDRELSGAPSSLQLLARAGAALLPGASHLPFVSGGGGEIPDLALVLNEIVVDRDRLAAYDRVCGFSLRDELPPTYPHVLAFPLQLALMSDGRFPFPAVGLVHIENTITQHRPLQTDETLSVRVSAGALEPHPRGRKFPLLTEVRAGSEVVWEEVSVNLRRGSGASGGGGGGAEGSAGGGKKCATEQLPLAAQWRLPGDLGRRYARVSGDHNPIHVHPLTARLFGFPAAIAHGMWTMARCLAAMEGRLPGAFTVQAAFRKPILLPATVAFEEQASAHGVRFAVRGSRSGARHLAGWLEL